MNLAQLTFDCVFVSGQLYSVGMNFPNFDSFYTYRMLIVLLFQYQKNTNSLLRGWNERAWNESIIFELFNWYVAVKKCKNYSTQRTYNTKCAHVNQSINCNEIKMKIKIATFCVCLLKTNKKKSNKQQTLFWAYAWRRRRKRALQRAITYLGTLELHNFY